MVVTVLTKLSNSADRSNTITAAGLTFVGLESVARTRFIHHVKDVLCISWNFSHDFLRLCALAEPTA